MKKWVFALFGVAVAAKLLILSIAQFQQPLVVMDETLYFLQAKEIWTNHTYILHNKTFGAQYPPLYPLLLSPLTVIADVNLRYMSGLAVNAIISSLLIFPVYEIARMYLNERKAFIISAVTVFAPISLTYSFVWMSENLYFLLFAYSVLWILREERVKAGIGVGLATLTKVIGLALIPFMIWKFRKYSVVPVVLTLSLTSIHFLLCLNATGDATGYHYSPHSPSSPFLIQLFLAFVYLSCATAPSLLNFDFRRHSDIIALVSSYTLTVAFASQLPLAHGRYYECLIPILLIPAFDEFTRTRAKTAKTVALCVVTYLFFALPTLIHTDLVNASLNLPTILSTTFTPLIVFAIAFALLYAYILTKDEKWRCSIALTLLTFI
ncbi:MAG: glycosyltransferase 87 family protein, partial [Candidatus Thorarchaeota archaeon]